MAMDYALWAAAVASLMLPALISQVYFIVSFFNMPGMWLIRQWIIAVYGLVQYRVGGLVTHVSIVKQRSVWTMVVKFHTFIEEGPLYDDLLQWGIFHTYESSFVYRNHNVLYYTSIYFHFTYFVNNEDQSTLSLIGYADYGHETIWCIHSWRIYTAL